MNRGAWFAEVCQKPNSPDFKTQCAEAERESRRTASAKVLGFGERLWASTAVRLSCECSQRLWEQIKHLPVRKRKTAPWPLQAKEERKSVHCPGIEPGSSAWEARILPLSQQCSSSALCIHLRKGLESPTSQVFYLKTYVPHIHKISDFV